MIRLKTAILAGLAAGMVAACQTTQGISLDDPSYTEWKKIPRDQSEVFFAGAERANVVATWVRWIEGVVRVERVQLRPKSGFRESVAIVWMAPVHFSTDISEDFRSPDHLMKVAHERCEGTAIADARQSANAAGPYHHTSCLLRDGTRCVIAQQGLKDMAAPGQGPKFQAVTLFAYCSLTESDSEMLGYLDALRIGRPLDGPQARENSI